MPISIPVIDMVEIGAGGGSLAHVDALKQIRVGPESAGSEPGPACYGRGGERPAVTDADLVLGKLDPNNFAGGSIKLSQPASEAVLLKELGSHLEMDAQTAAYGVVEVVDENMANAARVHAVENGEDLAEYTMIAFGGAAPLHAARLCEKLGVDRLLVPRGAGVGSAIGFLRAPFSFEANRSVFMRLSDFDAAKIEILLDELQREATTFVQQCDSNADVLSEYKVYMRYSGQGWEIPVSLSESQASKPSADEFKRLFETEYQNLFGRPVAGLDIEVTVWAVNATTPLETVEQIQECKATTQAQSARERPLFDSAEGRVRSATEIVRDTMKNGAFIEGPATITEPETTIIVPGSRLAVRQPDGCIDILAKHSLNRQTTGTHNE